MITTLSDLHRFANALGSSKLLKRESWDLAFTPHSRPEDQHRPHPAHAIPYGYGFGLGEASIAPGEVARIAVHGGLDCGGSAWFQRFLDDDRVVVFWNNVQMPPILPGLDEALSRRALSEGEDSDPPVK